VAGPPWIEGQTFAAADLHGPTAARYHCGQGTRATAATMWSRIGRRWCRARGPDGIELPAGQAASPGRADGARTASRTCQPRNKTRRTKPASRIVWTPLAFRSPWEPDEGTFGISLRFIPSCGVSASTPRSLPANPPPAHAPGPGRHRLVRPTVPRDAAPAAWPSGSRPVYLGTHHRQNTAQMLGSGTLVIN
jgi:hypothetical protein